MALGKIPTEMEAMARERLHHTLRKAHISADSIFTEHGVQIIEFTPRTLRSLLLFWVNWLLLVQFLLLLLFELKF